MAASEPWFQINNKKNVGTLLFKGLDDSLTFDFMISFFPLRPYMGNKNHLSIKSPKEKTNIEHMKYVLNDKELIQDFIYVFL